MHAGMSVGLVLVFTVVAVHCLEATLEDKHARDLFFSRAGRSLQAPEMDNEISDKLYLGQYAKRDQYPFVVYLGVPETLHVCTGALIQRKWVLTAAHCTWRGATHAILGEYDRFNPDGTELPVPIAESIRHPNYTFYSHDIALVRLAYPVNISSSPALDKVPLVKSEAFMNKVLANGKKCRVLGWGATKINNNWSATGRLQQMKVRFVGDEEMITRGYSYAYYEGTVNIEADYANDCGYGGTCIGDDGGPIVCKKGGGWVQAGFYITGLAYEGCYTGLKAVVNVQLYKDWIKSITGK